MANKPRLLVIGPRGLFGHEGGIEKFTDAFVPRALKVADVCVLCLSKPDVALPQGLDVVTVPRSKRFKTDKALLLLYAPFLYATQKFDHVFIFGTNFAVLVPLLKIIFWRRAKVHLRSGSIDHILVKWGGAMRAFMRASERLCRFADTVIAVAPSIRHHLSTLSIPSVLVRNGLDRQTGDDTPREPDTVIAVGRVTAQKNYCVLIEASHLLGQNGPQMTVIGGVDLSGESAKLQGLVEQKAQAKIHFVGIQKRDDVLEALKRKALYINCSIHEGMSNAVLEAIQQGIPLILSDIDANRDLGLDNRYYFAPNNPEGLALKIKEALADPDAYHVSPDLFENWDQAIHRLLTVTGVVA